MTSTRHSSSIAFQPRAVSFLGLICFSLFADEIFRRGAFLSGQRLCLGALGLQLYKPVRRRGDAATSGGKLVERAEPPQHGSKPRSIGNYGVAVTEDRPAGGTEQTSNRIVRGGEQESGENVVAPWPAKRKLIGIKTTLRSRVVRATSYLSPHEDHGASGTTPSDVESKLPYARTRNTSKDQEATKIINRGSRGIFIAQAEGGKGTAGASSASASVSREDINRPVAAADEYPHPDPRRSQDNLSENTSASQTVENPKGTLDGVEGTTTAGLPISGGTDEGTFVQQSHTTKPQAGSRGAAILPASAAQLPSAGGHAARGTSDNVEKNDVTPFGPGEDVLKSEAAHNKPKNWKEHEHKATRTSLVQQTAAQFSTPGVVSGTLPSSQVGASISSGKTVQVEQYKNARTGTATTNNSGSPKDIPRQQGWYESWWGISLLVLGGVILLGTCVHAMRHTLSAARSSEYGSGAIVVSESSSAFAGMDSNYLEVVDTTSVPGGQSGNDDSQRGRPRTSSKKRSVKRKSGRKLSKGSAMIIPRGQSSLTREQTSRNMTADTPQMVLSGSRGPTASTLSSTPGGSLALDGPGNRFTSNRESNIVESAVLVDKPWATAQSAVPALKFKARLKGTGAGSYGTETSSPTFANKPARRRGAGESSDGVVAVSDADTSGSRTTDEDEQTPRQTPREDLTGNKGASSPPAALTPARTVDAQVSISHQSAGAAPAFKSDIMQTRGRQPLQGTGVVPNFLLRQQGSGSSRGRSSLQNRKMRRTASRELLRTSGMDRISAARNASSGRDGVPALVPRVRGPKNLARTGTQVTTATALSVIAQESAPQQEQEPAGINQAS
ncbi:unnamed protein product [Amoebophrya sp. A120]|nr:unnamed protein product [Amoebophrya sp. A120]|eukprot:GSA120T00003868001.1